MSLPILQSISDDDVCSECKHCDYHPGDLSKCDLDWPGERAQSGPREGYYVTCSFYFEKDKK